MVHCLSLHQRGRRYEWLCDAVATSCGWLREWEWNGDWLECAESVSGNDAIRPHWGHYRGSVRLRWHPSVTTTVKGETRVRARCKLMTEIVFLSLLRLPCAYKLFRGYCRQSCTWKSSLCVNLFKRDGRRRGISPLKNVKCKLFS